MLETVRHYVTIDVLSERSNRVIYVRNADVGHEMHITVRAGSRQITLPTASEGIVQFAYEKPDGNKRDVAAPVSMNEAVFLLPRDAVDTDGDVQCELRIYPNVPAGSDEAPAGTWYTTPKFILTVIGSVYDADTQEEIEDDPTVYEQIVASETDRRNNEQDRQQAEAARQAAGYITQTDVDSALSGSSEMPVQNKVIKTALDGKSNTGHTHDDRYYTETETDTALAGKAAAVHTHDDRYYTENEVDELLAAATGVDLREYAKKSELADVATSGSYADLTNKPALLTQTAGTFTPTDQNADIAYAKVLQIGKAVFVSILMELSAAVTTETSLVLGTLSGVGRPGGTLQYMLCGAKSSAGVTWSECLCLIGTQNDYVNVSGFSSGDKQFLINAFYITD